MPQLVPLLKWEILVFLGVLATIVTVQLLTGQINTSGLFRTDKDGKGEQFSPARVQLLMFTLAAAWYYMLQVLTNPTPGRFPPIPETWPVLLGGSNLLYLGSKAYTRWSGRQNAK